MAIEQNLDMSLFKRQQAAEKEDTKELVALKRRVEDLLQGKMDG